MKELTLDELEMADGGWSWKRAGKAAGLLGIVGAGCGAITMIIRLYGAYPEGVSFAILVMNAFVPLIDRFTRPRPFGWREARKLEKAKAAAAKSK